jgi:hypothetical protein
MLSRESMLNFGIPHPLPFSRREKGASQSARLMKRISAHTHPLPLGEGGVRESVPNFRIPHPHPFSRREKGATGALVARVNMSC